MEHLSSDPVSRRAPARMPLPTGHRSSTALRALRVLEVLGASPLPMSVAAVAERLGVERAAAYRMLVTLVEAGYALRDANGRSYRLSHKVVTLSRHLLAESQRTEMVRECLQQLAEQTRETVHYSVLEGVETVLVQRAKGRQLVSVQFEVGDRSRLHCTSIGKAVLAFQDARLIERVIDGGLPRHARNTIVEPAALRHELASVRAQGYAYDDMEFADDMRCVAVPVFEPNGKVESGISISGPISRFAFDKLDELRVAMCEAARRLTQRIGGQHAIAAGAEPLR
jgi:DNA-binding IclR family transcriptional regulator